ncbi:MAG: enoyl-CoA hydratase/isomerase family protein [Ilumatobacteraceae bacterium]
MTAGPAEESRIGYELDGNIAWITIRRPEKRNAMTFDMLHAFAAAVERANDDPAAWVVIVTGSGGSFCAGIDLQDLASTPEEKRSEGTKPWFLARCRKPTIAAIDGVAVGMGAEFTSMCDVRIASDGARFGWNFAARGLVPDTGAGTWLLPRLIGPQAALQLLYRGTVISADEALRLGYVTAVVAPEQLAEAARHEALSWIKNAPTALAAIRGLVYGGLERTIDDHLEHHRAALEVCFHSADHKEGVSAFLERREPRFTGFEASPPPSP